MNLTRAQEPLNANRAQIMEVIQDMYGPGLLRASQFEAILQEEEQLKNTSLGTYYQDVEGDIEIDVAQVIGKNPIVCDTLIKTEKPMNMPSSQPNRRGGQANYRQYSFDLAQADPIFDELLKQRFITLSPGHILPSDKERKGKEYCKWHNSFRHNTNNCVTFWNCVQDLIQKGLLQYAKGDKEPMGIDANPFPKIEVNMVTASLSKRLGSTVEKKKREDENQMETDDELAKSHFSRFPNDYLCIRCGHEVEYGEAIMLEKEQKNAFSKSGIRFNTMGGNDLQIYVGAKLIYEGIDPGLFNRIESEHCYGPDDGPFLFRGNPVMPARPGVPSHQDLEAEGYQFPSRGRYPNHRGVGPRRGMGPRGRGPYGYGGHQPRMVVPPNQGHEECSTLSHPKFPAEGWYTKVSTSQKRRLQRKFAARAYGDPWDHVFEPRGRVEPSKVPNMVWTREQGESSAPKQAAPGLGGQDSNHEASSKSNAQPRGKKELRQSLKKKMEEFQKLIEADDDDLLGEGSEQEDLIKDTTPSPQQSATFGESLAAIQFGSVPINFQCNMILVLPKHFRAKPDQPMELAGDVEDTTQSTVKIVDEEKHPHSQLIKIETDKRGDKVVVLRSPDDASTRHLKPLYVKVHMNGQPISKVLVDNGAVVNILPSRMMKLLNKTSNDLIPTEVTVGNFAGGCSCRDSQICFNFRKSFISLSSCIVSKIARMLRGVRRYVFGCVSDSWRLVKC
ncbi:hypothetical protein RHGRI_027308 [Rhododendron griersonianum]|uniref:Uncharacterized protein n=1 Tax=Rhododendron griersonianum TaxID=479676 RepID=A0AAV6J1S7_9ERIC|nr:hypothetical protein RHGRI_027308 [Rhododendron griersonianum]